MTAVTANPTTPTPPTTAAERHSEGGAGGAGVLAGAVRAVSGMTLLSRLGGLARDLLLARIFGATVIGSAFNAGFAAPNLFRRLFGEGALSAAFIPEYAQAQKRDPREAGRLASLTLLSLLLLTTALTVIIELGLLAALLVLPANPDRALSFQLIMLMLPFMPLVCAAAILGGMLQVHGRFAPAASGPLVLNGLIIAAGVYSIATRQLGGRGTAYLLGGVTVLSGLTQCLWFLRLLRPHIRWTRLFDGAGPAVRRMLKRFVPVLIGMGTLQVNTFLDMLIAMWPIWVGPTVLGLAYPMDAKSNSILSFTQRLYQFPLGVFGIAVATAVFPMLARHADEPAHFLLTLRRGLRLSVFIGLPATVGLFLVREDLTATLFPGFSSADLARAAAVLAGFAPAVWAYSLNHVFTRAFYARGDTRTPMRVAIWMVLFNLVLNCILIWKLREAGLAWATAASATAQCLVLGRMLRPLVGSAIIDGESARALGKIVLAAIAVSTAVLACQMAVPAQRGWGLHLLALTLSCAAGIAAYAGAAWALRSHELRWLLHLR